MYFSPSSSPCGRFSNVESGMSMSPTRGGFLGGDLSIEWGTQGSKSPFQAFSQVQYTKEHSSPYHGQWWGENDVTTSVTLDGPPPASLAADTFRSQKRTSSGAVVAGRIIKEEYLTQEVSSSPIPSPMDDSVIEMMSYSSDTYSESAQVQQPRRKKQKTDSSLPPPPVRKVENAKRPGGRRSAEILPPVAPPLPVALQLSPPMPVLRVPKRKTVSAPSVAIATSGPVSRSSFVTSDAPGAIVSSSPPWAAAPTSPPRQAATVSTSIRSPSVGPADRPSDVQMTLSPRSFENFCIQSESYQKIWEEHMIAMEPYHEREAKSHNQHRVTSPSRMFQQ